jgi:hypothetical protein
MTRSLYLVQELTRLVRRGVSLVTSAIFLKTTCSLLKKFDVGDLHLNANGGFPFALYCFITTSTSYKDINEYSPNFIVQSPL